MRNSMMLVELEEAAARTGLAEDGAGMAWLLHTPHDSTVDLSPLVGEPAALDFAGFVLTERGRV